MVIKTNENGFTLYTTLIAITIIAICITLQLAILRALHQNTYYDQISIQQFFNLIQREVIEANGYSVGKDIINLELENGEIATIEQYGTLIRRQVNHVGHEIYLRDIKSFAVYSLLNGFKIHIQTKKGDSYEKIIVYYP
jgi:competence protein ComGF